VLVVSGRGQRRVTGLPGRDQRHQRKPVAVDELVDLRRQAAWGPADAVIRRLGFRIRVIRSGPVWRVVFVACWCAGAIVASLAARLPEMPPVRGEYSEFVQRFGEVA
jgi:hypothetical protein